MTDRLKILVVASEVEGLVKTGGLADVARALPACLQAMGHDVRIVMPAYQRIREHWRDWPAQPMQLPLSLFENHRVQARTGTHAGLPMILLEHAPSFERPGVYDDGYGAFDDNPRRFAILSKGALAWCKANDWQPDILHLNDWQSALAAFYLAEHYKDDAFFAHTRSLLSLHNAAYQGHADARWLQPLGIHEVFFRSEIFEDYGRINLLKGGIHFADGLNAVSPGYAEELVTDMGGHGLGAYFRARKNNLIGILNGCDYGQWSPETDPDIAAQFHSIDDTGKAQCKIALQREFKLAEKPVPLLVSISRLTDQKGFHLLIPALENILKNEDIQVVLLGSGDAQLAAQLHSLEQRFPLKLRFVEGYDMALAHRLEAGGDAFLMPSLFEPCGLNQIYSLRYGTLPLVRHVGGLKNTVVAYNNDGSNLNTATGFSFLDPNANALQQALEQLIQLYQTDPATWQQLQRNAMAQRFEWRDSAQQYVDFYRQLLATPRSTSTTSKH
ncbi:glycogen synthase [Saccharospirillum mangrovi]|uniref:glycogen synthase n=1 Tax=Saccharospirillum mangrovi TaxID=2161747 RepID=UPI000D3590F7|nr:glycogen synthase [Saccharospirillum mangrovi]